VKLPAPPDFDFAWTLGFLAARVVPSLEGVENGEYRRSLRVDGRPVALAVRFLPGELTVRSSPRLPPGELRRLVTRMFDLDVDLGAFHALASGDPLLRDLVATRPWIRLPQYLDPFEGTVRAILGQQVSLAAASTMVDRLVRRVGDPAPDSFLASPRPEAVAALGHQGLLELGLTRAKAASLHGLRMRTLGDRDAFPAADLGVIKALRALLPEPPTPLQIAALAESWRPWRAYATLHLWHSLG
jgi:AraC family transcriptional regulator, regulatory protein of adaptative response / DNA-3-methyladenine glycosylase II